MNPIQVFDMMKTICMERGEVYDHGRFRSCFGDNETTVTETWQRMQDYLIGYEKNKRGLALIGTPGIGKTLFMEAMERISDVKIWKPEYILHRARMGYSIEPFYTNKPEYRTSEYAGAGQGCTVYKINTVFCFDGVGDRNSIWMDYGTRKSPFEDILYMRGDTRQKTHLTSNMTDEDFVQMYGQRTWSRVHAICEIFVLIGQDCRIYKPKADIREAQRFS